MRTKQISHHFLTFVLLLYLPSTVLSQVVDTTITKPKIGLVLSGGGAKGLAHIGVLKVLEEYGIKPDIITGTSMGSIVGSLYAAGYTAQELSEINQNADWEQLLTDDVSMQKITMDEKAESDKYLFQIPIRDNKINLPAGLIEGQHLENYFSELFWPLTSHENFDSLPIPFHCMSVDMISGNTIEHKSGNLVKSIRASMSIPTVFSPVQMDSMLLVDGGITRNFPVQEAIDMGADIIIGVYVGFEEDITVKDLNSITDSLSRATALAGIVDAKTQNEKVDILIVPDLEKYGAGDFTKGTIIQQLGEDAAREHFNELTDLALKLNGKSEKTPKIKQPGKVLITDIDVEGLQYISKNFVLARSGINVGDSISHKNIRNATEFMLGTQYFRKLTYSLKKDNEDGYVLVFHVKENPRAMFKFTPNYDDDLGVGLVTNLTLKNLLIPSSRLLFTINIAENPGMKFELKKLLGKNQRFSDHIFMNSYRLKLPYFIEGNRLGNYNRNYFDAGYGVKYSIGLNHQLGADIFYKFNKVTPSAALREIYPDADFDHYKVKNWGYCFYYNINTTDDLYFPKSGTKLKLSFSHMFSSRHSTDAISDTDLTGSYLPVGDKPFQSLSFQYNWFKPLNDIFIFNLGLSAGFNSKYTGTSGYYLLGGSQFGERENYIDFVGYNYSEIITPNYSYLKAGLKLEILSGLFLSANANIGNTADSYEDLFSNFTAYSLNDYHIGIGGGIKYHSILGPIQLLVSDNNKDDELRFHFSVGFPF